MQFTCPSSGLAIPSSLRCNGYPDCPVYAEDEADCNPNAMPNNRPDSIWELDTANFNQVIVGGRDLLVEFYAPWCKACVIFAPKYQKAVDEAIRSGLNVVFAKVNTDNNPYLEQRFGINTYPRLLFFPKSGGRPRRYYYFKSIKSSTPKV
jgi:thioredoxin-like negative regulator of GroEL